VDKSVELIRYLKQERLLKCSLVAGKFVQGAITRSQKELRYINNIMLINFVGITSSANIVQRAG